MPFFSLLWQALSKLCISSLSSFDLEILSSLLVAALAALESFGFNSSIALFSLLIYFFISWLVLVVHTYYDRLFSAILATVLFFWTDCIIGLLLIDLFVDFSVRNWQTFASSILASVIYLVRLLTWARSWAFPCYYCLNLFICSFNIF